MRTQISSGVSERTRQQADELIEQKGYSLRDLVTIAIDRMYKQEIPQIFHYTNDTRPNFLRFTNLSDRYGEQEPVCLNDYRELNPEGNFEINGDEIIEYLSDKPGDFEIIARDLHPLPKRD